MWQGKKDSNPQQRFWRPTCYHYTIPLGTGSIIHEDDIVVNSFFRVKTDLGRDKMIDVRIVKSGISGQEMLRNNGSGGIISVQNVCFLIGKELFIEDN